MKPPYSGRAWALTGVLALTIGLSSGTLVTAQEPQPSPAPAATPAAPEHAPASGGALSAADIAKSNNPLGEVTAISFENYYFPTLYGVPNTNANTFDLRGVMIAGRQIIRATVPIQTTPVGGGEYKSGLGDIAIFDAIRISSSAKSEWAVGPLVALKTATDDALGSGKWQGGAALVGVFPMKGGSMIGFLATWQHSFAGDEERKTTNLSSLQPFANYSIGGGYYIRSSGVCVFDFENDRYLVPLGVGFGKATRAGGHLINAFIEPQFTLYHKGAGQPAFQVYAGIKWQWPKASKKG